VARPSRAHRRFHTDRIVANRRARFLREQDLSVYVGPSEHHNNTLSPIVDRESPARVCARRRKPGLG
jgi:hypothetical protein